DSREAMTRVQEFVGRFMPALVDRIELYLGQRPIFDLYGVEDEIGRALQKHVPLKSGGYLVLLPQTKMVGVSARIEGEAERARLKDIVAGIVGDTAVGYIVRTNAEGCDEAALAGDVAYLRRAWDGIEAVMAQASPGQRIYEDLPLPLRAMRDLMHESIEKVKVDSREAMTRLQAFVGRFMPALVDRIELYLGQRPIFDLYGVEDEIGRALQKHVPLKSGGYLVIDQTEAMTTVDVNTGSFLGQRNLEETVYRTNLEAAQSAARQLRLRNLGGIIIIDFIDMTEPEHRRQVLRMLEKSLAGDHARTSVHEFSPLGLVEMTRKRTTESLERQLCEPCPTCEGRGSIRTTETMVYEIFREVVRSVRQFEASSLLVVASPKVVARVLEEESAALVELEEFLGKSIRFQADEQCRQEQYDVVLL
ncbi:MAG: Rne/Rng family ribonuclease, partial [Proteobacteria bacterium]|nr:Rne/Rng family ribonuclease [Pseudomonadota bacterium]